MVVFKRVLWGLAICGMIAAAWVQGGPHALLMIGGVAAGIFVVGSAYADLRNDVLRVERKIAEMQSSLGGISRRVHELHGEMIDERWKRQFGS
jgi:hypothetical protein